MEKDSVPPADGHVDAVGALVYEHKPAPAILDTTMEGEARVCL